MIKIFLIFFAANIIGMESVHKGIVAKKPLDFASVASVHQFGRHICGASVISKNYVVTAAHCVVYLTKKTKKNLQVLIGSYDQTSGGLKHDVEEIIHHESYDPTYPFLSNIALLKLKEPLSDSSKKINLPTKSEKSQKKKCEKVTFAGWGRTEASMGLPFENSDKLHYLTMEIINPLQCDRNSLLQIQDQHLCAYNQYSNGIRFGDSGSPLIDKAGTLIGISCGPIDSLNYDMHPEIFTSVSYYVDWINGKINRETTIQSSSDK